jgi:hypothetical protein
MIGWEIGKGTSLNLDTLRTQILEYLEAEGIVVFYSYPRSAESSLTAVFWDTDGRPDFRDFIAAAKAVGARMVTLYSREFGEEALEDVFDQLANADLDRDQRRKIETRLRELRAYTGSVCQLELSFDHGERVYVYDMRTEWYEEMSELVDQIEDAYHETEGENPLGGYYSNN